MADQAIPFEKLNVPATIQQLTDAEQQSLSEAVKRIKGGIKALREDVNKYLPMAIQHVIAGGNIATVNKVLRAANDYPHFRDQLAIFCEDMVPHVYDRKAKAFGKKYATVKKQQSKVDCFIAFQKSKQTVFSWVATNTKPAEKQPTDYGQKLKRDMRTAIRKGGFDAQAILAILHEVTDELENEAKAKATKAA